MPTTPATGDTRARTVEEQFLELICNDDDLLAAEFDAIIAAEWPEPPPTGLQRRRQRAPRKWRGHARRPCPRYGLRRRRPGAGGWARRRSPRSDTRPRQAKGG